MFYPTDELVPAFHTTIYIITFAYLPFLYYTTLYSESRRRQEIRMYSDIVRRIIEEMK